jgi:formylglycine-generating enzyme
MRKRGFDMMICRARPVAHGLGLTILLATAAAADAVDAVRFGTFAIDRTEVTVGRFRAFANAAGLVTGAERDGGGFAYGAGWERRPGWTYAAPQGTAAADDEPAVHVSWDEAAAFCAAAGGRLPSRDEWAAAAYSEQRAAPTDGFVTGRTYVYPVGNRAAGMNTSRDGHVPVGTTRAGVNGLHDMGGNVWEWLADRRGTDALTAGGSWWYGPEKTRTEGMQWKAADFHALYVGFRCAYDAG